MDSHRRRAASMIALRSVRGVGPAVRGDWSVDVDRGMSSAFRVWRTRPSSSVDLPFSNALIH